MITLESRMAHNSGERKTDHKTPGFKNPIAHSVRIRNTQTIHIQSKKQFDSSSRGAGRGNGASNRKLDPG